MTMERYIRAIAGSFILISLLLSHLHSPRWLFFRAFVGLNLLQSTFTHWCLMEKLLEKLGIPRGLPLDRQGAPGPEDRPGEIGTATAVENSWQRV